MAAESFFSRWSRRKAEAREAAEPPVAAPAPPQQQGADAAAAAVPAEAEARTPAPAVQPPAPVRQEPPPTWEDVARLTPESDFSRFVSRGVDEDVKRAALKKLFSDPHFNQMDGLDVYIDDYTRPDPIPATVLRKMAQSAMLGLFRDEEERQRQPAEAANDAAATAPALPADDRSKITEDRGTADAADAPPAHDENPAVQLQPDDAAGRPGAEPGPER